MKNFMTVKETWARHYDTEQSISPWTIMAKLHLRKKNAKSMLWQENSLIVFWEADNVIYMNFLPWIWYYYCITSECYLITLWNNIKQSSEAHEKNQHNMTSGLNPHEPPGINCTVESQCLIPSTLQSIHGAGWFPLFLKNEKLFVGIC